MSRSVFILLFLFAFWVGISYCTADDETENNPSENIENEFLTPEGISEVTFLGKETKDSVTFHVYLPKGYNSSQQRYPVVYQLHGINGGLAINQENLIPALFNDAFEKKIYEQAIIVFPDGYKDSFWADSYNSVKPAETNIVKEIIPFVDSAFRTKPERKNRIIQGFSMGGFGAAKFAAKFPELFGVCIIYDGALLNWQQVQNKHPGLAEEIFNNDEEVFNKYSPWYHFAQNAEYLKSNTCFRMIVGKLKEYNIAFYDYLTSLNIPVEKVDTDCAHVLGCLLETEGINSVSFISECSKLDE